jgi:hypothetical protein
MAPELEVQEVQHAGLRGEVVHGLRVGQVAPERLVARRCNATRSRCTRRRSCTATTCAGRSRRAMPCSHEWRVVVGLGSLDLFEGLWPKTS